MEVNNNFMARTKSNKSRQVRQDGRFCVQFRFEGKRYSVYGDSKKSAETAASVAKDQLRAGTYLTAKEKREKKKVEEEAALMAEAMRMPSFSEYAKSWMELKRDAVAPATLRTTRIMVKLISDTKICSYKFGELKLDAVTAVNIRDLQKELSQKASTRTTNDAISMVRGIFRAAIADRLLVWNPADNIKAIKRKEELAADTIHRALTSQEIKSFFDVAKESWLYNLYVVLLHTGLRCGEACALTLADIDEQGVNVRRTITRTESGAYTVGDDTKTAAGRRFVPLDPEARQAIRDQMMIERAVRPSKIIGMNEPVFKASRGGILYATLVNQDISRICQKSGIEKFTVHAFRDTFATKCVQSGMEVKELQTILGHTDVAMTLGLYAHSSRDRKIEQLNAVNFM